MLMSEYKVIQKSIESEAEAADKTAEELKTLQQTAEETPKPDTEWLKILILIW